MHPPRSSALLLSFLLAPMHAASMLSCDKIRVDGYNFDLSPLGGPHSVVTSRFESSTDAHQNTTYTVDICQPLKKSGKAKSKEECPNGTRGKAVVHVHFYPPFWWGGGVPDLYLLTNVWSYIACAITRFLKGDQDSVTKVVAIAGGLENAGGSQFDYEATRLKNSDSNSDSQKEGLRLVLKGGKHPLNGPVSERREQKAVIEFICDPDKTGTEGEWASEDEYEKAPASKRAAEDDKGDKKDKDDKDKSGDEGDKDDDGKQDSSIEHQLKNENAALIWEDYADQKGVDVLRLTWYTKYACEKRDGGKDDDHEPTDSSASWGFFTWFVIM